MDQKRTLQIVIGLLIIMILGTSTILIPYLIRQRQEAEISVTPTAPEETLAWKTQQSANASCVGNQIYVEVNFTNTEPDDDRLDMDVEAVDLQTGKSINLGTVRSGNQTATGVIETGVPTLNQGQVRFNLNWSDGRPGSDSRTVNYGKADCAGVPANARISHMDCTEILAVLPDAPQGLENSRMNCKLQRPGDQIDMVLDWSRYDGPVAKWDKKKGDYYSIQGEYRLTECQPSFPDHPVDNLPFLASLNCEATQVSPTPTPTPSTVPSTTPPPPTESKCALTIRPKSAPSGTPTPSRTPTPTGQPTVTPTPTGQITATPTASPTPQPECNSPCSTDAQCKQFNSNWTCNSSTLTCRHVNWPQQTDCNQPGISCNKPCSTNSECAIENPDYICYNTGTTTLCRHKNNPGNSDCQGVVSTPTPTLSPQPTATVIAKAPTLTPTPMVTAEEPQLPTVGTSLPTLVLSGLGVLIIVGALILAL